MRRKCRKKGAELGCDKKVLCLAEDGASVHAACVGSNDPHRVRRRTTTVSRQNSEPKLFRFVHSLLCRPRLAVLSLFLRFSLFSTFQFSPGGRAQANRSSIRRRQHILDGSAVAVREHIPTFRRMQPEIANNLLFLSCRVSSVMPVRIIWRGRASVAWRGMREDPGAPGGREGAPGGLGRRKRLGAAPGAGMMLTTPAAIRTSGWCANGG